MISSQKTVTLCVFGLCLAGSAALAVADDNFDPVHPSGATPVSRMVALAHTNRLPDCDKIVVYTLEFHPFDSDRNESVPNASSFPIRPYAAKARILGTKTLTGDTAKSLCVAWRSLTFDAGAGALCHLPVYGLRFFRSDELLFETSVCWKCGNFYIPNVSPPNPNTIGPHRDHRWYGFRGNEASEKLLRVLRSHLPHPDLQPEE